MPRGRQMYLQQFIEVSLDQVVRGKDLFEIRMHFLLTLFPRLQLQWDLIGTVEDLNFTQSHEPKWNSWLVWIFGGSKQIDFEVDSWFSTMDEIDNIILHSLRQIGWWVVLPTCTVKYTTHILYFQWYRRKYIEFEFGPRWVQSESYSKDTWLYRITPSSFQPPSSNASPGVCSASTLRWTCLRVCRQEWLSATGLHWL